VDEVVVLALAADYVCDLRLFHQDATMSAKPADPPTILSEPAAYLDMPPERRVAAKAHAAMLSATMKRVAAEVPFQSDVDDFRRILTAGGK
jgi:hypothetical protein